MSKPLAMVENLKYTLTDLGGSTGKLTLEWETIRHGAYRRALKSGAKRRFAAGRHIADNYRPADTIGIVCDFFPEG